MSAHKIQRQKIYFHFLNCENLCFVFVVVSINLVGVVVVVFLFPVSNGAWA